MRLTAKTRSGIEYAYEGGNERGFGQEATAPDHRDVDALVTALVRAEGELQQADRDRAQLIADYARVSGALREAGARIEGAELKLDSLAFEIKSRDEKIRRLEEEAG